LGVGDFDVGVMLVVGVADVVDVGVTDAVVDGVAVVAGVVAVVAGVVEVVTGVPLAGELPVPGGAGVVVTGQMFLV